MKLVKIATDARQSNAWGNFLQFHGWQTERIANTYIFFRAFPVIKRNFLKIQHPKGPLPIAKIEKLALQQKALFTIIEPHPVGYEEKQFITFGYRISKSRFAHSATMLIDLRPAIDKIFSSFSETTRRNIRKAERNLRATSLELAKVSEKDFEQSVKLFYDLYKETGKLRKFYVPSYEETSAKIRAFQKTSLLLFAYERNSSTSLRMTDTSTQPVAALWVGAIDKTLVYFHPGNTERGYNLLANYLLVWEAIQWGKKHKLTVFDFETAYDTRYPWENKQWLGYTAFKKRFGGELVEYPPSYIKFYHPVAKFFYTVGTFFSR